MSTRNFFTADEKSALVCLVKKHRAVFSKETGPQAIIEKKLAWIRLTEDFNMVAGHSKRTQAQRKKLWENEKMRRKKELGNEKRNVMLTGGGRFISTAPVHDAVDDVLNDATDIELHQVMDSDAIQQEELFACSEITYCSQASQEAPASQEETAAHRFLVQPDLATQVEVVLETAESPEAVNPIRDLTTPLEIEVEMAESPEMVTPIKGAAAMQRAGVLPIIASVRSRLKGSTTRDAAIQEEAEQRFLRNQVLMKQDRMIFKVRLETEISKREAAKEQREAAKEQRETAKERREADKVIRDNDVRSSELRRLILERQLKEYNIE